MKNKFLMLFLITIMMVQVAWADEFQDLIKQYNDTQTIDEKKKIADKLLEVAQREREAAIKPKGSIEDNPVQDYGAANYKARVYFEDGRVCQWCSVSQNNIGYVISVMDKKGNEWLLSQPQQMKIDKHPRMRQFAQSYQQTLYNQALYNMANPKPVNVNVKPTTTNCYMNGSYVNCNTW